MTEQLPTAAAPRRASRWIWSILIVSLALNLFVMGVVARAAWPYRYAIAGGGGGGLVGNLIAFSKTLPDPRRVAVEGAVSAGRPDATLRAMRRDVRLARRDAAQVFKSEPFNRDAFLAAEARVLSSEAKVRSAAATFAADIAAKLTTEERTKFLKWRELRRPGGLSGGGKEQIDREPDAITPPK